MCLYDLKGDGDHKLIIVDLLHNFAYKHHQWQAASAAAQPRKLKIYMGTNTIYETYVPERPVGLEVIFDRHNKPY